MTSIQQFYGTGRRKTASARVFIRPHRDAKGSILVNQLPLADYLPGEVAQMVVYRPLVLLGLENSLNVYVTVRGGGKSAQRDAIRHGIARALIAWEEGGLPVEVMPSQEQESEKELLSFRRRLRAAGEVTRDRRKVERKKVGLHKARKAAQYSKR